jgi:uncharacterized protein
MRLDRILQSILPHHDHFFDLFEESVKNISHAAEAMLTLPGAPPDERDRIIAEIISYEHRGDKITHQILAELNRTFVTPFDPEDIHVLASALDDILDNIEGSARRFMLYKITDCPLDMLRLIESLQQSVLELEKGIHYLRKLTKTNELEDVVRRVNLFEHEADAIFQRAVADLFEMQRDPIEIIKLKEIYVTLETATDCCEDVADVLETILIKHA